MKLTLVRRKPLILGQALRDNGIGELLNEPLHVILVLLTRISAFQKRDRSLLEIPDHYLTSLLFPSLYSLNDGLTKNEEQILALERRTGSLRRTDYHSTDNEFLLLFRPPIHQPPSSVLFSSYHEPATPDHGLSKAQILNRSTSDDKNEFVLIRGRNLLLEDWVELLFFAPDQPPTSDPQPRSYNSQLGTCILQLIFCSFLPPTC